MLFTPTSVRARRVTREREEFRHGLRWIFTHERPAPFAVRHPDAPVILAGYFSRGFLSSEGQLDLVNEPRGFVSLRATELLTSVTGLLTSKDTRNRVELTFRFGGWLMCLEFLFLGIY